MEILNQQSNHSKPRKRQWTAKITTHIKQEWVEEAKYHPDSYSGYVRDAILAYRYNRYLFKFREILEAISSEMLLLYKWKEKGHPGGLKWTEREEYQLEHYERCFEILQNSPFNKKIKKY